jgi:hypothetical protein
MLKSEGVGDFLKPPSISETHPFHHLHARKKYISGGKGFFTPKIARKCHRIKRQYEWQRK